MAGEEEQRKLQALLVQIRAYQGMLQELSRQIALAEAGAAELSETAQAVEELPRCADDEALIPIGAGVYVKAKITDKSSMVVFVGAGAHVEKSAEEAKAYLIQRKESLVADEAQMRVQQARIGGELEKANAAAEELYVRLQGGGDMMPGPGMMPQTGARHSHSHDGCSCAGKGKKSCSCGHDE